MKEIRSSNNNNLSSFNEDYSEEESMESGYVVRPSQASRRRLSPLAVDFAGIVTPRPVQARQERDPRPSLPTWLNVSNTNQAQMSEEDSMISEASTSSQKDVFRRSTLDLVLEKRYLWHELGRQETNGSPPKKALKPGGAVTIMEGSCGHPFHPQLSTAQLSTANGSQKSSDTTAVERADSVSTTPTPPSLHQDRHYTPLGAYRMTSQGLRQDAENHDDVSLHASITSYPAMEIIEATLVPGQSEWENEVCAGFPAPPQFTNSMGDRTIMTQVTAASTMAMSPLVEALPLDEIMPAKEFFRTRSVRCLIFAFGLVFIVLALGTAYGVREAMEPSLGRTPETKPPMIEVATSPPTIRGDLNLDYFVQSALPESTRSALKQENSPQSKAFRWLRNNTFLEDYTLSRRLQRFALATFYFSTGGERRWRNREGWLSDENECRWYSTGDDTDLLDSPCDGLDEELRRLKLPGNDLRGTLPLELSLLTSLEVIELSDNLLTGLLPTSFGDMSALREVYLSDNFLSGTIPREIGEAAQLEILDIGASIQIPLWVRCFPRLISHRSCV
jgi:Leucine rich repeat